MVDYKNKIRKLLSLAESPNREEAKVALLKARELMAEHKLTEAECKEMRIRKVLRIVSQWTSSKNKNPWAVSLGAEISEHYCCKAYIFHAPQSKTYQIGFIGLEDDVRLCIEIFNFAMECVTSGTRKLELHYLDLGFSKNDIRENLNSYGYGFLFGLREAYKVQEEQNQHEWGLVLSVPREVQNALQVMKKGSPFDLILTTNIDNVAYYCGNVDGYKFDPSSVCPARKDEKKNLIGIL